MKEGISDFVYHFNDAREGHILPTPERKAPHCSSRLLTSAGATLLPSWPSHTIDADTWDTTFGCLMSVIFLFVVPWDCVWRNFVVARGDRWRWNALR